MEGQLALDWRSGWAIGGSRGPAIEPGSIERSLLARAIQHTEPDLKMPEQKLSDQEIRLLLDWITQGAEDPRQTQPVVDEANQWWSLRPLVRPTVPSSPAANPIDTFIREKLRAKNLDLSPPTDRATLLRRWTADLTGVHPTYDQIQRFVADTRNDANERMVDQLLASPRYGERWARHWLDTIHFADSHGFEHDVFRPNAWRFRDYVIDSLNADKPWSQFIREQVAADWFFPKSSQVMPALGFLGAGPYDQSAAATAPNSFEYLDRDDLVTQVMAAFVSTTANCARCHAHKFDPISQADYFALQAVFAGVGKGDVQFDASPEIGEKREHWSMLLTAAKNRDPVQMLSGESQILVDQWESSDGERASWRSLAPVAFVSSEGATLTQLPDQSILVSGNRPEKEVTTFIGKPGVSRITAVRLDLIADPSLPQNGPGRAENGNLHLSEIELQLSRGDVGSVEQLTIANATADFNQVDWTVTHAIDRNPDTALGIHPEIGKNHHAVFELTKPVDVPADSLLTVVLRQSHGRGHTIGRFRLSVTDSPVETARAVPTEIESVLSVKPELRSPQQRLDLACHVVAAVAELGIKELPPPSKVYAASKAAENERGVIRIEHPREIRVLKRGDLEQPLETALPGALSTIESLPSRFDLPHDAPEAARRAALADWLASSDNPLVWRSLANRIWQFHFGVGLVDTPNDFGRMGSLPSHPELLDYLACELRDNGGSVKALHRLICTSDVYRQSSASRPELLEFDPENRYLGKFPRQRLDAEGFHDAVLALSGALDLTMAGPGVSQFSSRPGPQVTPVLDYNDFDLSSQGASRRSIYRVVWRGIPDPFYEALDFPDLGSLTPDRGFSASALQSLVLLNNRFVLFHSQKFAERIEQSVDSQDDQIALAIREVLLREPTSREREEYVKFVSEHGLAAFCRALLNSNEFLFVE